MSQTNCSRRNRSNESLIFSNPFWRLASSMKLPELGLSGQYISYQMPGHCYFIITSSHAHIYPILVSVSVLLGIGYVWQLDKMIEYT